MSVQLIITDPSKTAPVELQAAIRFLQQFAVANVTDPRLPIASDDLPDAGLPQMSAAAAFSPTGEMAAAAAFGGNASAATPIASFQVPALPGNAAYIDPSVAPLAGMPADQAAPFANFNPPAMTGLPQMGQIPAQPFPTAEQFAALSAGAPSATPGPLLDVNGDKWDERIHAGTKTTTAKGVWKAKPGVDKVFAAEVLAANKGGGTPSPVINPPQMQPAAGPTPAQLAIAQAQATAAAGAAPPQMSVVTYAALLGAVQQRMVAGHLSALEMQGICQQHGAADLPTLVSASPQVLESVFRHMTALLQQKGVA